MKKRVLSLFMAFVLCLTLLPAPALAVTDTADTHAAEQQAESQDSEGSETSGAPEENGGGAAVQMQTGTVDYVYAEDSSRERLTKTANCTYLVNSDAVVLDGEWYAVTGEVTINGDVTFTNSEVNLILCNRSSQMEGLKINGTLTIAGELNIYGQTEDLGLSGSVGSLTIAGGEGFAIAADSDKATINFYGGSVRLSSNSNALDGNVTLKAAPQMGMYCAIGDYSSGSGEKQLLEAWQNNSSFNAPAFYVDQEGQYHDGFEYTLVGEDHHIAVCKHCGYSEGGIDENSTPKSVGCSFDLAYMDPEDSDADYHYLKCECGRKNSGAAHVYGDEWSITLDLQGHAKLCESCGYPEGEPESHTNFLDDTNTCTKCGFVYIASNNNSYRFNDLDKALHAGGSQVYICAKTNVGPLGVLDWGVDANIAFDPVGEEATKETVSLWTQGRVLYADMGSVLNVYSGTLTLTNNNDQKPGIQIIQDGWDPGNGESAVYLKNGTLIFKKDLTASGGHNTNASAQYPAVAAHGGSLSFNGNVALEGGLYLTSDATLETELKAGDRFYAKADSGKDVSKTKTLSIEGSTVYKNLAELLDEGCAFAYCDAAGNLVDASGNAVTEAVVVNVKNLTYLTQNVKVVEHTHTFKSVNGDYICECGAVCAHTTLDENYKCTLCGLQYVAECNGTYCESLLGAINVSINNNGAPVKVLTDTRVGSIVLSDGKSCVLDLNGKTVTATDEYYSIEVTSGATLQLKGTGTFDGMINVRGEESRLLLTDGWNGTVTNILVQNAQFEISSGTVSNVLSVQDCTVEQAKLLNITGGTFAKFGNTFSTGFDKTGCATLQDLVASGYTLQKKGADESYRYLTADERAQFEILEKVTVVPCEHIFTSGTCPNCGAACPHTEYNENGVCKDCGKQAMVAKVGEQLFNSFEAALDVAIAGKTTLVLLDDVVPIYNGIGSADGYTIDLNGKTITAASAPNVNGTLVVVRATEVTLTDSSEAKTGGLGSVLHIVGTCTITGGNYTLLTFGEIGSATISDCTVTKAISAYTGKTVASYLKSGYAVYLVDENNSATVVNGYVEKLTELTDGSHYEIREHKHSFGEKQADGAYHCDCGFSCAHMYISEAGENAGLCPTCGMQFDAKVTDASGNVTYYTAGTTAKGSTIHGVKLALENAPSGSTVKALTSGVYDVDVIGGKTLTLDMNGTTNNGGSITLGRYNNKFQNDSSVDTGNTLTLTGNGKFVSDAGSQVIYDTFLVFPENTLIVGEGWSGDIGQVSIMIAHRDDNVGKNYNAATVRLSGGTFQKIGPQSWNYASMTAGSWLMPGYAFRHTDGEKAWVRYDTKLETEYANANNPLENVKVVECQHASFENGKCVYCNYECTHETIDPATGTCAVCGLEYTAKIGDVYYTSLYDAFEAAKDGDTIWLLRNTNEELRTLSTDGKTLELHLNGFNLSGHASLYAGDELIHETEADLKAHAGTLKISGKGNLFMDEEDAGKLLAQGYSTLDLSQWSGTAVRMIEANPNAKIILPASAVCKIQYFKLNGVLTDGLLQWNKAAPRYSPTFGVIYRHGNGESTVTLGDLLKNAPEGCAFYHVSDEGREALSYNTEITDSRESVVNVTLDTCFHADKDFNAVCDYCGVELLAKHESFDAEGAANTTYILLSEGVTKIAEYVKDSSGASQRLTLMQSVGVSDENRVTLTNENVPLTLTMGAYANAYAENDACNLSITLDAIGATVTDGKYGTLKANTSSTLNITGGEFNVVELNNCGGSFTGGTFNQYLIENSNRNLMEYLPIGYAYQKIGGSTVCSGSNYRLLNVTVVTHEDNPGDDGLCACGRRFGASLTVEGETATATRWYKTLFDATEAANQTDGAKTIKLYQNYTGADNPEIENGTVTLELNEKVIGPSPIRVNGATLTIQGKGVMTGVVVNKKESTPGKLIIKSHDVTVSVAVAVFNGSTAEISGGSYNELNIGPDGATAVLSGGSFGKIVPASAESVYPKDLLAPGYAYRNTREFKEGTWVTRAELEVGVTLNDVTVEPVPVTAMMAEEEYRAVVFGDVYGTNSRHDLILEAGNSEGSAFKESFTIRLYVDGKQVGDEKAVSTSESRPSINIAGMFASLSVGTYTDCHVDVTYRGYTTSTKTFTVTVLPSEAALSASLWGRSNPAENWQKITESCEYGTAIRVTASVYGTGTPLKTQSIATFGANAQPQSDYFVVLDEAGNEISARVARDPLQATLVDGRLCYPAALDLTQTLSAGEHDLTVKYVSASGLNTGDASIGLTVTVNKKELVPSVELTIPDGGYVYDGTEKKPAVTVKDGDTVIPADEYDVTYGFNVDASTYAMVMVSSKKNYDFGTVTTLFTIAQKSLDGLIQFSDETLTYTGEAQAPAFTASYMGKALVEGTDYTVAYYQGETKLSEKPSDAGDYRIELTGKGNFTGTALQVYTIHKATITDVAVSSAMQKTYNGEPQKWSFTVQATAVNNQILSFTYSDKKEDPYVSLADFTPFTNAGRYKVYCKISAPNHEDAYGETEVVINPLSISFLAQTTVTLSADDLTYNGEEQTKNVTKVVVTTANEKTLEVTTYEVKDNKGTNAGDYELTVTGTGNFTGSVTQKWSIAKKQLVSIGTQKLGEDPAYTGEPLTMRFIVKDTTTGELLVEGQDYEVVYDGDHTNVGTAKVRIQPTANGNYKFLGVDNSFTIHSATLTNIAVKQTGTLTYNGEAQTAVLAASATAVNNQPTTFTYSTEENGTYTETIPSFTEAGTYTLYYKVSAPNHNEASGSFDIVIGRKNISGAKITLESSLTYSGAEQTQTVTKVETSDGLTVTTYDVTDNTGTNAGSYELTVTGEGNFEGSATQVWNIARKPLTDPTIEIEGGNVYTGSPLTPKITVKDGETVIPESEYSVRYDRNTNVGTAEVTLVDKEGGNYAVSGSSIFEIGKADASCTAPADNVLTYNGTEQTLVTAGTANGGTMYYSLAENGAYAERIPTGKNAGTYTVWYKVVGDSNHNDTAAQSVDVTIKQAAVTVTAKDKSAYVGDKAPDLSKPTKDTDYMVSGLFGEDALEGTITLTYDGAPDMSKVGEATIRISGTMANDNYAITYVDGKLTISVRPSSGGGGGGSTTTNTETTTNPDGSTTKTETKSDGTVIETTTNTDGSTSKTESKTTTKSDGTTVETVTETNTGADGSKSTSKTETTTAKDGSKTETKTETKTEADGTKSETKSEAKTDASGVTSGTETTKTTTPNGSTGTTTTTTENGNTKTEAEAKVSEKVVEDAKKSGEAVKVPTEVKTGENSNSAPTVKVELPKNAGETKIEIPVSDVNSGTVAVIVYPDGTEEIVKDSKPTEDGVQLTVDGSATVKIIDNSKDFIDTRDHWSRDEVNFVASREIFNGVGNNLFGVGQPMTRGMVNTALARLAGIDTTPKNGQKWYEVGTEWAKSQGITDGTNPEASVTREQLATLLYRFCGTPEVNGALSFSDAHEVSDYAQSALLWATQNGILNGVGNNRVAPSSDAQRAQVAAMMARYLKNVG